MDRSNQARRKMSDLREILKVKFTDIEIGLLVAWLLDLKYADERKAEIACQDDSKPCQGSTSH